MRGTARLLGACFIGSTLAACAAAPLVQQKDYDGDAHAITVRSGFFARRSPALKIDAEQAALKYCSGKGRALVALDTRVVDPDPPAFSTATVEFRCVPI